MTTYRSRISLSVSALALAAMMPAGLAAQERQTIVHGADEEPATLDPAAVEPGEGGESIIFHVYERLLTVGPDSPELMPSLATEVPSLENGLISEDGLTYTFPLREGVTFHDGTEFTADDVKYSWDRVMELNLPGSAADILADKIAETRVVDDYTFEVTLNEVDASFLYSSVLPMTASIVSQDAVEANGGIEAADEYLSGEMVGTGPYTFGTWNRTENLSLEVNEDYWGEMANDNVRLELGVDPDVRVLGLRAGEFDTIETDPTYVPDFGDAEGVNVYSEGLLLEPLHIGFNMNVPEGNLPEGDTIPTDFFTDVRIRQAFNHAFNYSAFLNGALGGFGEVNPHYVPIGVFGYDPEAPVYNEQNLEEAERLFKEAGVWDEGFTVTVVVESGSLFEIQCLILKDSIEAMNPDMRINVLGVAEAVFDEALATSPVNYAMWAKNGDPAADPIDYLLTYAHPDGEWGEAHGFRQGYENPDEIASMIEEAAVELDRERRAEIIGELQRVLYEDPMWIIGAQEGAVTAYRDRIDGMVIQPLWPRPSINFAILDKTSE
ncbi:ABC transporter substrate-binding protein [Histidinibacterium aquaticum]|uniref:ABC transporter substrate-binding protein n=1 Tax=Histidinibacterium aquaticum TaxID=2613962 RepID=A0A5J5GPM9_9RHOB|nr:ABC transporter substrate-binding protein [Histidinibacterium aquaticum]KAA9009392.1 ABC transporter substrate-binding protein [Histidinibacterium aquaticum]